MPTTPRVVVIAGPNGAGKSTIAPVLLQEVLEIETFVNADTIAKGLSGFAPEKVAIQGGKIMLEHLHRLASQHESFAFETTLASRSFAPFLHNLKKDGYIISIFFLFLESPELAINRVAKRVLAGGHTISEDAVRRRYGLGLKNLEQFYKLLADNWSVWNTSTLSPVLRESTNNVAVESIQRAFRKTTQEALERHKRLGESVAIWQDGKVVILGPKDIPESNDLG
jgi:predicted ABC-type ATPase